MIKAKRLISFVMAGLLAISNLAISAMAKDEKNTDIAEIKLGKTVEKSGFSTAEFTDLGQSVAARGDDFGWLLDVSKIEQKGTINFAFSDDFKPVCDFDGSEYEMEIEYYNESQAVFAIYYDAYDETRKRGELTYTQNDKLWTKTTIKLDDAVFNRRLDGKYDFALSLIMPQGPYVQAWKSENSVVIKSVKVKKIPKENPVFITAEVQGPGNSFRYHSEEKKINLTLDNISGENFDGEITYKIVSADKHLLFEKTENVVLADKEKRQTVIDVGNVTECGIYDFVAEIKTEDKQSERVVTKIAIIKSDPDGIRNKDVVYATYFFRNRNPEGAKEGTELLSMSNVYGGRVNLEWSLRYNAQTGEVDPTATKTASTDLSDLVINEQVKYGMHPTAIFIGSPAIPGVIQYGEIPGTTPEQLVLWKDYIRAVGEEYKGKIEWYEVWNEPNIGSFNRYRIGGDIMGRAAIAAEEALHEVNPDAIIGGCGYVGLDYSYGDSGRAFFDKGLEVGMWKNFDVLSVHNYSWGIPESYCENYVKEIGAMKEEWKKYKGEYPKIWSTEAGFHGTVADVNYSKQKIGSYTARQIIFFKEHGLLEGPFTIHSFDPVGIIKTDREVSFGHVGAGHDNMKQWGTMFFPTEAYLTMAGYNYCMAETDYEKTFNSENNNVRIRQFDSKKFGTKVLTLNTVNQSEYVTLNLGVESLRYFDTFGNETTIYGDNGIYSLAVTGDPVYLVGDIKGVEYKDQSIIEYSGTEFNVAEDDILGFEIKNNTNKDYTVSMELPQGLEAQDENIAFENGKATVRLYNRMAKDTEGSINVKIMDGEKVVQFSKIKVKSGESATLSLDFKLAPGGNVDRWQGVLRVRNESATKPIKGTLKFKTPELLANMDGIDVGLIPTGRTGEVIFNLPKLVRKGEYSFECELQTDDDRTFSLMIPYDFTIAKYAKTKPVIDGIIEDGEWPMNTAMYTDSLSDVVMIDTFVKSEWQGADDLSARSIITWDEQNMYALFEVTDNIFANTSPIEKYWENDGIQFGIVYDEIGDVRIGQAHTKFHEFGLNHYSYEDIVYRSMCQEDQHELGVVDYGELAVKTVGNKHVYEFKIPWEDLLLEGDQPKIGDVLGFSFLVNDNDGEGRRGWIEYASGIGMSKSTSMFTYLTLIE